MTDLSAKRVPFAYDGGFHFIGAVRALQHGRTKNIGEFSMKCDNLLLLLLLMAFADQKKWVAAQFCAETPGINAA